MDPKEAARCSSVYSPPPSEEIYSFFKKVNCDKLTPAAIEDLSKKVLLSPEHVTMWLYHLKTVQVNRRNGAVKAAETRRKKQNDKK